MEKESSKIFEGKDKNVILGFLRNSYHDYLSSRLLFFNHHLAQACFLASTAIEKALKARLSFDSVAFQRIHDCEEFLVLAEGVSEFLRGKLNKDFLKALHIIYKGRYLGDQKRGYHFTIVARKFLAELDYSIDTISQSMTILTLGERKVSYPHLDVYSRETNNPLARDHNYILRNIDKTKFCEQLDTVLDFRILPNYTDILLQYPTVHSKNDGKFIYKPISMNKKLTEAKGTHEPYFGTFFSRPSSF